MWGVSKSMDNPCPIKNTSVSKDRVLNNKDKNILSWSDSNISSSNNVDHLVCLKDI